MNTSSVLGKNLESKLTSFSDDETIRVLIYAAKAEENSEDYGASLEQIRDYFEKNNVNALVTIDAFGIVAGILSRKQIYTVAQQPYVTLILEDAEIHLPKDNNG